MLKQIIINSWKYLTEKKLSEIYGFVIMPNHIHLLWDMLEQNGKESVAVGFTKYTAYIFKKYLQQNNSNLLEEYQSDKKDRDFQFWKRDPLAIPISTREIFYQKLDYMHFNPTVAKWGLAAYPEAYYWSNANFYYTGYDEFGILTHFDA